MRTLCAAVLSFITLPVHAALIPVLGGQAYYDDVADLSWTANASINGSMNWAAANAWAASLNINGITGWRLPEYNCANNDSMCVGSELNNMFYNVLGGTFNVPIGTSHNVNYDLFTNIADSGYWTGTENISSPGRVWGLNMTKGVYYSSKTFYNAHAWAVYSGGVSAVPVPAAVWLFGSGLLGLVGIARRKQA